MVFQLTDSSATFIMKNSKRSDSGQYRLQLRNISGYDTATINVRVLDRPAPPENLRADEFAGEALTLFWSPPKDDGGAAVSNYVVEKKEHNAPAWSKVLCCLLTCQKAHENCSTIRSTGRLKKNCVLC